MRDRIVHGAARCGRWLDGERVTRSPERRIRRQVVLPDQDERKIGRIPFHREHAIEQRRRDAQLTRSDRDRDLFVASVGLRRDRRDVACSLWTDRDRMRKAEVRAFDQRVVRLIVGGCRHARGFDIEPELAAREGASSETRMVAPDERSRFATEVLGALLDHERTAIELEPPGETKGRPHGRDRGFDRAGVPVGHLPRQAHDFAVQQRLRGPEGPWIGPGYPVVGNISNHPPKNRSLNDSTEASPEGPTARIVSAGSKGCRVQSAFAPVRRSSMAVIVNPAPGTHSTARSAFEPHWWAIDRAGSVEIIGVRSPGDRIFGHESSDVSPACLAATGSGHAGRAGCTCPAGRCSPPRCRDG